MLDLCKFFMDEKLSNFLWHIGKIYKDYIWSFIIIFLNNVYFYAFFIWIIIFPLYAKFFS